MARSKDLSHAEDLQKTPSNPQGQGGKYRGEEGREAGRQAQRCGAVTHTHTHTLTVNTHIQRGGKHTGREMTVAAK